MENLYKQGTSIWIPDNQLVWIPATIIQFDPGNDFLLAITDDGKEHKILLNKNTLPTLKNPDILRKENNLTSLSSLNEPSVLDTLKARFLEMRKIYTYCGIVLVAFNPYTELASLYNEETITFYKYAMSGDTSALQSNTGSSSPDPHIYALAQNCLTQLSRFEKDQSIIISGESGAGKTVTAKYIMRYLANTSNHKNIFSTTEQKTMGKNVFSIENRALASNPIMEAIGNAKTIRNDNSSRFGKYLQIYFAPHISDLREESYQICGAQMKTYLLEKSRVIIQSPNERNFHIFYQLCALCSAALTNLNSTLNNQNYRVINSQLKALAERLGLDNITKSLELDQLGLRSPKQFKYLNFGQGYQINGVDDIKIMAETMNAFILMGFNVNAQKQLFKIIASILHLGNLDIDLLCKYASQNINLAQLRRDEGKSITNNIDLHDKLSMYSSESIDVEDALKKDGKNVESADQSCCNKENDSDIFKQLSLICHLLGVSSIHDFVKAICVRRIEAGAGMKGQHASLRGNISKQKSFGLQTTTNNNNGPCSEIIYTFADKTKTESLRDTLAKDLYSRLFNHIVTVVNESLKTQEDSHDYELHNERCENGYDSAYSSIKSSKMSPQYINGSIMASQEIIQQNQLDILNLAPENGHHFIGLLDIYGFEKFVHNSFEQLCINYANEKLQQHFNAHVFKLEQQEYMSEGLEWNFVAFHDNQPCLDLIEGRLGILDLLNEQCMVPNGSDDAFCQKLYQQHGSITTNTTISSKKVSNNTSSNLTSSTNSSTNLMVSTTSFFKKPKFGEQSFIICHSCEDIEYNVAAFCLKNQDKLSSEDDQNFTILFNGSTNTLVKDIFGNAASSSEISSVDDHSNISSIQYDSNLSLNSNITSISGNMSISKKTSQAKQKLTVSSQFRDSLKELMYMLHQSNPHYIRCIKPNDDKLAFTFDPKRVVQQLRACGILETIKISAAGFPSRWLLPDFLKRYHVLVKKRDLHHKDLKESCNFILDYVFKGTNIFPMSNVNAQPQDKVPFKIGATKIFFRSNCVSLLEKRLQERRRDAAICLQKNFKRFVAVKQYGKIRQSVLCIQRMGRGYIARKKFQELRRTKAAIKIQTKWRSHVARQKYLRLKFATIIIQKNCRRKRALVLVKNMRRERAIVTLQSWVRMWIQRKLYREIISSAIIIQCCWRRYKARVLYKKLKAEANTIAHQKDLNRGLQNLNRGLENKLIELKIKLDQEVANAKSLEEKYNLTVKNDENQIQALNQKLKESLRKLDEISNKYQTSQETLSQHLSSRPSMVSISSQTDMNMVDLAQILHAYNNLINNQQRRLSSGPKDKESKRKITNTLVKFDSPNNAKFEKYALDEHNVSNVSEITSHNSTLTKNVLKYRLSNDSRIEEMLIPIISDFSNTWDGCCAKLIENCDTNLVESKIITDQNNLFFPSYLVYLVLESAISTKYSYATYCVFTWLETIKSTLQQKPSCIESTLYWLSNVINLYHVVTWNMEHFEEEESCLTIITIELQSVITYIYSLVVKGMASDIFDSIRAIYESSSSNFNLVHESQNSPAFQQNITIHSLLEKLENWKSKCDLYSLDDYYTAQIFRQIIYVIGAMSFNALLHNKSLCNFTKATMIRHNISLIESWVRKNFTHPKLNTLIPEDINICEGLECLSTACKLFQFRKNVDDCDSIISLCKTLTPIQTINLLESYEPTEDYEPTIPPQLLERCREKLGLSSHELSSGSSQIFGYGTLKRIKSLFVAHPSIIPNNTTQNTNQDSADLPNHSESQSKTGHSTTINFSLKCVSPHLDIQYQYPFKFLDSPKLFEYFSLFDRRHKNEELTNIQTKENTNEKIVVPMEHIAMYKNQNGNTTKVNEAEIKLNQPLSQGEKDFETEFCRLLAIFLKKL